MQRQRGFTIFELVTIIALISILVMILLNRFYYYQEVAEKTVMEMTVMNMRSGLRLRIADLKMQGRMNEMEQLMQENPINWLETLPANYRGELTGTQQHDLTPGNWYFDTGRQELVYVVQHDRFFEASEDEVKTIHFHATSITHPRSKDGNTVRRMEGIALTPVNQYQWF